MGREQRQRDEGVRSCALDLEVNTSWLELVKARNPAVPSDQVPSGSLATVDNLLRETLSVQGFPNMHVHLDEFFPERYRQSRWKYQET